MTIASQDETRFRFGWLLAPDSAEDFLSRTWDREPRHFARPDADYFADLLRVDDLDEILEYGRLRPPGIRVTSLGVSVPPSEYVQVDDRLDLPAIRRLYREGHSIVLNGLERVRPAIGRLVRAMQTELSFRVEANAYLTPAASQAFRPHFDTHDVIVLQLHGAKEWRVYNDPEPSPLPGMASPDLVDITERSTRLSLRLTAGDTLYVPRGWIHEAASGPDTSSLHLTLGIHTPTWYDLLARALEVSALKQAELRRALPAGFLHRESILDEMEHQFERLRQAPTGTGIVLAAIGSLHDDFIRRVRTPPDPAMIRTLDRIDEVEDHTKIRTHWGAQARIVRLPDGVGLQFATSLVRGSLHYEDAMRFVLDCKGDFRVADLPGLDAEQRIALARRLIAEGLLALADPN